MTSAESTLVANPMTAHSARNGHSEEKPIAQRALLVKLQVSNWGEQAIDKEATEAVAQANNVAPGAGKYTKRLLNKDATAKVRDVGRQARSFHNSLTIPWDDNGTRLLPIDAYDKYTTRVDQLVELRRDAVNELINDFQRHVDSAQADLGGLFDASQYPDPESLRNSFNMSVDFDSVSDSNRFIAEIPEAEREKIKQAIEQRLVTRINAGLDDICQRLAKLIKIAQQQMQDTDAGEPNSRIYDTMVTTLRDMVENIPLINITNDPRLNEAAEQLLAATANLHADNLRPKNKHFDATKREQFKQTVDAMAEQFSGYFV